MPRYRVKSLLQYDGHSLAPGEVVELSLAQARAMPWAVELALEEKPPAPPGGEKPKTEEKPKS